MWTKSLRYTILQKIDVLFVNPDSSKKAYQELSKVCKKKITTFTVLKVGILLPLIIITMPFAKLTKIKLYLLKKKKVLQKNGKKNHYR